MNRAAPALALLAMLLVGGCRDAADDATAEGAAGVPAVSSATTADPLAGVESDVDTVERDLDADAGR